ncbi:MAG: methyltransferase domain-containing protein [Desulfamplus sp.]|nr:methyltransferase domain-containing protein [Desulfamplus sp.]
MSVQLELWRSNFGWRYAERNNNLITDDDQRRLVRDWGRILAHAVTPFPESALEVGCNIGRNLIALRHFIQKLHGIDPNRRAIELASKILLNSGIVVQEGDAFKLPFVDCSFDLVLTSGVLIHIAPNDLSAATDEIMRVSKRYIVCIEYFSHKPEQIPYHGMDGFLFKRDFGRFYLERYPDLKVRDYGFLWQPLDSSDNSNWWLFEKPI